MDVVGVGVQGPAAVFHHGADLISLRQGRLGRSQNLPARNVENTARRNYTPLGPLGINRPVALEVVASRDIRQPVVVVDAMRHKGRSANAEGRTAVRIAPQNSTQAANRLPVVLVLIERHCIIRVLNTHRDHQFRRSVPFEFGERLRGLGNEMLVEVRQRRVELTQNVGWVLIPVRVGPVIP